VDVDEKGAKARMIIDETAISKANQKPSHSLITALRRNMRFSFPFQNLLLYKLYIAD